MVSRLSVLLPLQDDSSNTNSAPQADSTAHSKGIASRVASAADSTSQSAAEAASSAQSSPSKSAAQAASTAQASVQDSAAELASSAQATAAQSDARSALQSVSRTIQSSAASVQSSAAEQLSRLQNTLTLANQESGAVHSNTAPQRAKQGLLQRAGMVTDRFKEDDCSCFDTTLGCLLKVGILYAKCVL